MGPDTSANGMPGQTKIVADSIGQRLIEANAAVLVDFRPNPRKAERTAAEALETTEQRRVLKRSPKSDSSDVGITQPND